MSFLTFLLFIVPICWFIERREREKRFNEIFCEIEQMWLHGIAEHQWPKLNALYEELEKNR